MEATTTVAAPVGALPGEKTKPTRLASLDALRGFDMFWIMGGEGIAHALAKTTRWPVFNWLSKELEHTPWHGFTFYDMIFPLFLFIAGVSMPFSLGARLAKADGGASKRALYASMIRRTLLLIFLGMVVNGLFEWNGYENTRFASVLGRIGLAWFFAGLIYLNTHLRGQILWFVGLLVGYWAAMTLVPVPGFGAGVLTTEGSLAAYLDRLLLPGKLYLGVHDPEGLFSAIPAVGTALLGVFTGRFLRHDSPRWPMVRKGIALAVAGTVLLGLGSAWNLVFPINKNLWTSSFVVYVGGWSLIFLAVFYLIIDVAGYRRWAFLFTLIGLNSITIYLASHGMINFLSTANFFFGGLIRQAPEPWQAVWTATAIVVVQLALLYFLYRNKLFLRV
ncbi:MAG: DUF5009 domain-containing protein [Ferruginibacter sp.]|nr:DUF5009 domain-containing protein [Cytophagales bacterium]